MPEDSPASPAPPRTTRRTLLTAAGLAASAGLVGTAAYGSISSGSGEGDLRAAMTIIAPAAAGGGWDTVAREMQQAHRANGIVNNTQVVNIPGAGGTIALTNLSTLRGDPGTLIVSGTGLLAATIQYDSAVTFEDVTALALTVEEYDVIVVPGDSPYETLDDLIAAWVDAPGSVPWTGGGSFDQLVVTDLAIAAGIAPVDMNFIPSDGGGEATQALLNGTAHASASGYPDSVDQIEAGRLRALALVAQDRMDGFDVPTTVELGYDVTLANWRLMMAPGGITEEEAAELGDIIAETIATPEWAAAVDRYNWTENVMVGAELTEFLAQQTDAIRSLYEELGV